MHTCPCTHTPAYAHTCPSMHTCPPMHMHTCPCTHMSACARMSACVPAYLPMYTHTHAPFLDIQMQRQWPATSQMSNPYICILQVDPQEKLLCLLQNTARRGDQRKVVEEGGEKQTHVESCLPLRRAIPRAGLESGIVSIQDRHPPGTSVPTTSFSLLLPVYVRSLALGETSVSHSRTGLSDVRHPYDCLSRDASLVNTVVPSVLFNTTFS